MTNQYQYFRKQNAVTKNIISSEQNCATTEIIIGKRIEQKDNTLPQIATAIDNQHHNTRTQQYLRGNQHLKKPL